MTLPASRLGTSITNALQTRPLIVAPVVAGMGKMEYGRFLAFNVFGGIGWVLSMTFAGYFLGQVAFVQRHFEAVILGIIFLSILPGLIAAAREWKRSKAE